MFNERPGARRFYAVSYNEDEPTVSIGSFIPPQKKTPKNNISYTPQSVKSKQPVSSPYVKSVRVVTVFLSVALLLLVGLFSGPYIKDNGSKFVAQLFQTENTSTPVVVENPYTKEQLALKYGVQLSFNEPNFFADTRDAFIREGKTFIEADLTTMQLRFFENGVLNVQVPILSKGKKGSWWETPAGLYEIEFKEKKHFSSFGQVYTPWNMAFQGNFFIHGWPYKPNGEPVAVGYSGGCIRLSDEDAEKIFNLVTVNTPVLVHEVAAEADSFVYEPKIPELATPNYLIADVESSTVLASSDLDNVVPIASLTKLMTALVAAEYINLDKSVYVHQPTFVQSLIPRLKEVDKVSMYSLLQLLLVESSNEAAEVIASQVGREKFMQYMNEKALSIGMTNTHFADPSGLSEYNTSTVRDLLALVQYLYNNRRFVVELTADQNLPTAYVSGQFGELNNFNEVKGLDNFIGGKVGETTAAKQTSITLHKIHVKGTDRIIAIVLLGSESRNADVKELLTYAQERFGY